MTTETRPDRPLPRRTVLAASGTAVLAACVACGSSSTTTSSTSAAATGAAAGGTQPLAAVADVPAAAGLVVPGPDGPVLLARKDGAVVAHSAICTHAGGTVAGTGICPLHGSKFDIITGAVQNGPATSPLAEVAVTETGGQVVLA